VAKVSIKGMDSVNSLFRNIDKGAKRSLRGTVKKASSIALSYAQSHIGDGFTGKDKGKVKRITERGISADKATDDIISDDVFADYGFTDGAGVKHPGNHYLRDSIDKNRSGITSKVLDEVGKVIDGAG